MVHVFSLFSMALGLLLLIGIFFHGRRHVQGALTPSPDPAFVSTKGLSRECPKAAVIVPVAGYQPQTKACLKSLLSQNYPGYEVLFVTRDMEDPAVVPITELVSSEKGARHIVAGQAESCGQKNHNLLAGINAVSASAEILIFCDSSHYAHPNFLYQLVRPIVEEDALLASGYHRVTPDDFRLATIGMLLTVLAIHLLQGIRIFAYPWGGATAIRRSVFLAYGVDRLWAENVVDDFSMGPYLRRFGIKCRPVPAACLETDLEGETVSGWTSWLKRQMLYLKFCIPGAWLAAVLPAYLLVAPMFLAVFFVCCAAAGVAAPYMGAGGLFFLIAMISIGILYRSLTPEEIPLCKWLSAFLALLLIAGWCYVTTWFTNHISWKGISYRVGWGGKVKAIAPGRFA